MVSELSLLVSGLQCMVWRWCNGLWLVRYGRWSVVGDVWSWVCGWCSLVRDLWLVQWAVVTGLWFVVGC